MVEMKGGRRVNRYPRLCFWGYMRRRWAFCAGAIVMLLSAFMTPVSAWEFELDAEMDWVYYYESQAGREGFFGPWNVDRSGNNVQNQNFWPGANNLVGIVPGTEAAENNIDMSFNPTLRVNRAVSIQGGYYVGTWTELQPDVGAGDLVDSEYPNSLYPGTGYSFSPGYWNTLWFSAKTPWGTLGAGKRAFVFGLGSLASGEDVTSTEALQLTAPYGPMQLGLLWFPWRLPEDVSTDYIVQDAGFTSPGVDVSFQQDDQLIARSPHLSGFFMYGCGSMEFGYLYDYFRWSIGPESLMVSGGTGAERLLARNLFIPRDLVSQMHILYAKYFNGLFFFNAEASCWDSMVRHQPNANRTDENSGPPFVGGFAGAGSVYQTNYTRMWRYMVETGVLLGPTKISAFGFWSSGFDRRAGVLIDRQGAALWVGPQNTTNALFTLHPNWSNSLIFDPYNYLMVYTYAGGINTFDHNGDGFLADAFALALRADYSVAANLVLWASFLKANRVSKGYGWGYLAPDLDGDVAYTRVQGFGRTAVPAIPDDDLGWEVTLGMEWQLLEGLGLNALFAYWQPGKWFSYACISRANPGWANQAPGNLWGIAPDRTIDPVLGVQITLSASL